MSSDTKAIIGTIVATGLAVAGLLSVQISGQISSLSVRIDDVRADTLDVRGSLHSEMRDLRGSLHSEMRDLRSSLRSEVRALRSEMGEMRATMDRFDARLDAVEVALGQVDQRLLTIERVVLPATPSHE